MIKHDRFDYSDAGTSLQGYYAFDDKISGKRPAVLVVHDWSDMNEFAMNTANRLAELGYVGIAIDMYGKGKTGKTKEEKSALMQPLMQNRAILQQRINAGLSASKTLPNVDANKIAAIGFCFGGLCALDLARSGAAIKGAVSFHGLLKASDKSNPITAKILVLHGYDDPMVSKDEVHSFCDEMNKAKVDWQLFMYSHTMHAFMNPEANDPAFGTVYNKLTATRAWNAMQTFFKEIFA